MEVVPHAREPAMLDACFRSGAGGFDLVRVDADRIVARGLHDDGRQAAHVAVDRGDTGQPRIGGPYVARRPFGAHRRKNERIAQRRSRRFDVDGEIGPRADQAECGRGLDAAIAQRHGQRQGQPSASRITGDDGRFRVEPVVEQAGVHRSHLFEGHWIVGVRCAGVVGDQRRHSGRRRELGGQAAVAPGAAQGVGTAVQVDQRPAGCRMGGLHPLDRDTGDADALKAGALGGARAGRQRRQQDSTAGNTQPAGSEQWPGTT